MHLESSQTSEHPFQAAYVDYHLFFVTVAVLDNAGRLLNQSLVQILDIRCACTSKSLEGVDGAWKE